MHQPIDDVFGRAFLVVVDEPVCLATLGLITNRTRDKTARQGRPGDAADTEHLKRPTRQGIIRFLNKQQDEPSK